MFIAKQKNRKRRPNNNRPRRSPRHDFLVDIPEDEFLLKAEVGTLDDLLADLQGPSTTPHHQRQDILPPPELGLAHHDPRLTNSNESNRRGLAQFVVLLLIALGLVFWLFYTGG